MCTNILLYKYTSMTQINVIFFFGYELESKREGLVKWTQWLIFYNIMIFCVYTDSDAPRKSHIRDVDNKTRNVIYYSLGWASAIFKNYSQILRPLNPRRENDGARHALNRVFGKTRYFKLKNISTRTSSL